MNNFECTYRKKKTLYDIRILHIKLHKKSMVLFNLSASTKQERYQSHKLNSNLF